MDNQGWNKNIKNRLQKTELKNNVIIAATVAVSIVLVVSIFVLVFCLTKKNEAPLADKTQTYDASKNNQKEFGIDSNTEDVDVVYYYVRKSSNDTSSQLGAFHYLENAMTCADENAIWVMKSTM